MPYMFTRYIAVSLLTLSVCALLCPSTGYAAGWVVNTKDASDPLQLQQANCPTLHVVKGLGPVFATEDGDPIGPGDYSVKILSCETKDNSKILHCQAVCEDLGDDAVYTLQFTPQLDGSMEMIVSGGKNVLRFQCGNIAGEKNGFKQFYIGQRDMESHAGNDGYAPMIYWPAAKLYLHGLHDLDVSHAAGIDHRVKPRQNFLAKEPPISSDALYAVLTDKTRPALYERYCFRTGETPWDAYGPITNRPSEYREELSEMVFNDLWDLTFQGHLFYMDWLKNVTAGRVKFYTVLEQWGFGGFDDTLPDLYRRGDYVNPAPMFGTKEQLAELAKLGNTMGRFALRTNYILVQGPDRSYSIHDGFVKPALNADGSKKWHSDLTSIQKLLEKQDTEFHEDYGTTAAFSDQLASGGFSGCFVNFDATEPDAGTLKGARQHLREMCKKIKQIHKGPLGSETLNADFEIGEYMDTGDFTVFAANTRNDFTPEYKLRRFHQLATTHSMGLGHRFFFSPGEPDWMPKGFALYFENAEAQDAYRAGEVLYGNGGYLFYYGCLKQGHALTECFTVGVAQRYYTLQAVDYVKYSQGGRWKRLEQLIADPSVDSLAKLQSWFRQFHIRYANGCHVYVNLSEKPLSVVTSNNETITLPKNGWLVYTEDGNLTAYTAQIPDPYFPSKLCRVDFCEDKARKIKYANPRQAAHFKDVKKPTVWLDDKIHYVLETPEDNFAQAMEKQAKAADASK